MWFWWYMMFCNCMIPILMIVLGWYMWKHCPKDINGSIGYRTKRSMKNSKTWKFAHEYCGHLWIRIGLISLVPSILILLPFVKSDEDTIGWTSCILILIQLGLLIGSIIMTEWALEHMNSK